MTKSSTDIPMLDDEAIAEIEARYRKATEPPWDAQAIEMSLEADKWMRGDNNKNDSVFMAHARADIPALCATVRALRAEMKTQKVELLQLSGRGELLAKVHINFDDLDPLAAVRNEFDRLRNIVIRDLQSQLEQVTKERDEEKRLRAELKQIAQTGIAEVSSVGTTLGEIALTDFRSRAIALCRDKAAEWAKQADEAQTRGIQVIADGKASRALAAKELASALEKLK